MNIEIIELKNKKYGRVYSEFLTNKLRDNISNIERAYYIKKLYLDDLKHKEKLIKMFIDRINYNTDVLNWYQKYDSTNVMIELQNIEIMIELKNGKYFFISGNEVFNIYTNPRFVN